MSSYQTVISGDYRAAGLSRVVYVTDWAEFRAYCAAHGLVTRDATRAERKGSFN